MYVGDNKSLLDKLDGTGTQLKSFTFLSGPRQGQFASFPELNGRVLTPNPDGTKSWKLPDDVGLLEVSKGEWSTEGPPKLSSASVRVIPALASAAGNTQALINELDNLGALRTGVVLAKISPVVLDETATLEQFNLSVTEALSRLQSGAAIKDDELPRFQKQFEIQARDLFAPQHMMQKIVQAAALTRVGADLFAENITPQKAIELIQESAAITFTEEEIARMGKGEAKQVLREKTDKYLSVGQSETLSPIDEIRVKIQPLIEARDMSSAAEIQSAIVSLDAKIQAEENPATKQAMADDLATLFKMYDEATNAPPTADPNDIVGELRQKKQTFWASQMRLLLALIRVLFLSRICRLIL